jgi:hypothetical protein
LRPLLLLLRPLQLLLRPLQLLLRPLLPWLEEYVSKANGRTWKRVGLMVLETNEVFEYKSEMTVLFYDATHISTE